MKKLLTFALSVGMLAAFAGEGAAQPKPQEKTLPATGVGVVTPTPGAPMQATTVKGSKSNSDNRATTVKSGKSNSDE